METPTPKLSIVTPAYNRVELILRSITSSLELINSGVASEVIIIDDASTDGLSEYITLNFSNQLQLGKIRLITNENNQGVTYSKNLGVEHAENEWVIFMDSDDYFSEKAANVINHYFSITAKKSNCNHDLVFFRVVDSDTGELIGSQWGPMNLSLRILLNYGTPGECVPMVRKDLMIKLPFNSRLRGNEGLTWLSHAAAGANLYLSDSICRVYDSSSNDRLSSFDQRVLRSEKLLLANIYLFRYVRVMTVRKLIKTFLRVGWYSALFVLKIFRSKH